MLPSFSQLTTLGKSDEQRTGLEFHIGGIIKDLTNLHRMGPIGADKYSPQYGQTIDVYLESMRWYEGGIGIVSTPNMEGATVDAVVAAFSEA